MCVIACKPAGVPFPTMETLKNCWMSNPQGAGVAWWDDGFVRIEKGMMTWEAFEAYAEKLHRVLTPESSIIYHFRITSRGEKSAEQCHPYPLSADDEQLKGLSLRTDCAVAHNGTMPISCEKGMNDTQTFVKYYLTNIAALCPDWLATSAGRALAGNIADSKLAFLKDNAIITIGKFIEADGMLYSNSGYLPSTWNDDYSGYSRWWPAAKSTPTKGKKGKKGAPAPGIYASMTNEALLDALNRERNYAEKALLTGATPWVSTVVMEEARARVDAYMEPGVPADQTMNDILTALDLIDEGMGWL